MSESGGLRLLRMESTTIALSSIGSEIASAIKSFVFKLAYLSHSFCRIAIRINNSLLYQQKILWAFLYVKGKVLIRQEQSHNGALNFSFFSQYLKQMTHGQFKLTFTKPYIPSIQKFQAVRLNKYLDF